MFLFFVKTQARTSDFMTPGGKLVDMSLDFRKYDPKIRFYNIWPL